MFQKELECVIHFCVMDFIFITVLSYPNADDEGGLEIPSKLRLVKETVFRCQGLGMSWEAKWGVATAQTVQVNSANRVA